MTTTPADLMICADWVIPVQPRGEVVHDGAVVIENGHILAVLPKTDALAQFTPAQTLERPGHVLLPGLFNGHTHAAMTLLRGLADDLPLAQWLNERVWPAEQNWVSARFVRDGTELAIAEMLLGGTTCFSDMYFFPDVIARTSAQYGMRAVVGIPVFDFATAWAQGPDEYLSKGLEVRDAWKADPLIHCVFAPHAPYTVSPQVLRRIQRLSDQLESPVHIHLHETADEVAQFQARYGKRPLEHLAELGLLSPALIGVHMTQLVDSEIEALAHHGAHVMHCPESNMKLGSGNCRVPELLAAGVNVGLGTDGAASNNDLDMFGEMRSAALLAKTITGDPTSADAAAILHLATLGGAQAFGLAHLTGSLTAGKWADLISVDLRAPNTQPLYDPISQLVYAASASQVQDVWVGGHALLEQRRLTRMDQADICARAGQWGKRIAQDMINP